MAGYNGKHIKTISTAKGKKNPFKDDVIVDPEGQWKYPGQVTKIPSGDITMKGVPYPVLGIDNLGNQQMMQPGMDYSFPGQSVTEYPQMAQNGLQTATSYNIPLQKQYSPQELKAFQTTQSKYPDSDLENFVEILDPTGISSWDDVYRSAKESGMSPNTYMELLGALPLLGKIGKGAKIASGLAKTSRQARSANTFIKGVQAASIAGKASDTKQTYDQYQKQDGGWLDKYAGGGSPSVEKAKAMLEDGTAHGHPLTQKQRDFFKSLIPEEEQEDFEEYKQGGTKYLRALSRNKTSRNIKTSINFLMARNFDIHGLAGARFYDPNEKFETGGWLDKYK